MKFLRTNGGVAHYADEGPRSAPAIVFINSLGTDLRIWDEVAAPLARRWRAIRYDKRGHGLSSHPAAAAGIGDFAADLAGLIDNLKVGAATIVGISIGGLIAQELYRSRRDLVASLVLCDTGCRIGNADFYNARADVVQSGGIETIADGVLERWFTAGYRTNNPDMMAGWRAMLTRTPRDGYAAACRTVGQPDFTEAAKSVAAPTTVIVGDEDGATPPELARQLAGLIPGARLEIVAGAGHLPCIERPEAMRALIEAHMKAVSP